MEAIVGVEGLEESEVGGGEGFVERGWGGEGGACAGGGSIGRHRIVP